VNTFNYRWKIENFSIVTDRSFDTEEYMLLILLVNQKDYVHIIKTIFSVVPFSINGSEVSYAKSGSSVVL
jgi:hypothetical protein